MSQKVESIAKNVQGETTNMKNQFSNLEHSLKELSQGGLFGQIDGMIQELKRLNEINGKYEMRYFLLCVELERRSKIISEYLVQIQSFEETIRRKDYEFSKEIERIREEEVVKTRRILESEIVNLKNQSSAERARLERRVQELQIELANRDSEIEEFKKRLFAKDDIISRLKSENQELSFKNSDMAKYYETEITRIRNEHQQILIEIETRYKNEIEITRRLGEDERNKEVEKQKKSISDYYSQQIGQRENELSRLTNIVETTRIRITELERENGGIHMQLDSRTKEVSELRDQLSSSKRNHEEYILRITETHRMTIQKAISERDKEMKDKLELELSRIEKELKEKKNIILGLEQRILYMEKENERGGLRLNDILIERDELKSRLIDVEKQLGEELRMLEENYSVQMEEREGQLRVLEVQNRELHELYVRAEEQERSRTGGLVQENEMLKREMQKLRELGEMRNREIEEWKVKYKSYVTAEE
jgi:hypothetical protein